MFRINLCIRDEGMALLSQFGNRKRNKRREVSPLSPVVAEEKPRMHEAHSREATDERRNSSFAAVPAFCRSSSPTAETAAGHLRRVTLGFAREREPLLLQACAPTKF